jgi:hypothetical protein
LVGPTPEIRTLCYPVVQRWLLFEENGKLV